MPLRVPVDAPRLLGNYLRSHSEITALVSTRVSTRLPENPQFPYITLSRIGGIPDKLVWGDNPRIQVDAWGRTELEATAVALKAFAVIMAIPQVHALGIVTDARPQGPLVWAPDTVEEPPLPRYRFDVSLTTHPVS